MDNRARTLSIFSAGGMSIFPTAIFTPKTPNPYNSDRR